MNEETVRDGRNQIVGFIHTESNGNAQARKMGSGNCGYYYKSGDYVTDANGRRVGSGKGALYGLLYN
jgi:hypothetical protein